MQLGSKLTYMHAIRKQIKAVMTFRGVEDDKKSSTMCSYRGQKGVCSLKGFIHGC